MNAATPVSLQIQLPADPTLSAEQLERITGRSHVAKQIAWLEAHHWFYELAADGSLLVGALYANLRLAGLQPAGIAAQGAPAGFDLSQVR